MSMNPTNAPQSVANETSQELATGPSVSPARSGRAAARRLHRIHEVRQQQGVSLRTAARHMELDTATVREQEKSTSDLRLTDLVKWQEVLDVPLADLLVDNDAPLSRPVLERARLVRLMKTAAAISEKSETPSLERLARMLVDQIVEIMPELKEVSPWHSVGQRRSLDEVGQIMERRIRDDFFVVHRDE